MQARKVQGEIDRTLKKVQEGVEVFDQIWEKVYDAENSKEQKEKHEADLKKEIKKLQRYRDQIKQWLASNEIKEKKQLLDARKLIEREMERFKVCEKETKTKAFSKEGLSQQAKAQRVDPKQKQKDEVREWVSALLDTIGSQTDEFEQELESYAGKKMKQRPPRFYHLEESVSRHKEHIRKLEQVMRLVDSEVLSSEEVQDLREMVEDYVERGQDDFEDFADPDDIYSVLPVDIDNAMEIRALQAQKEKNASMATSPGPAESMSPSMTPDSPVVPLDQPSPAKDAKEGKCESSSEPLEASTKTPANASAAAPKGVNGQGSGPAMEQAPQSVSAKGAQPSGPRAQLGPTGGVQAGPGVRAAAAAAAAAATTRGPGGDLTKRAVATTSDRVGAASPQHGAQPQPPPPTQQQPGRVPQNWAHGAAGDAHRDPRVQAHTKKSGSQARASQFVGQGRSATADDSNVAAVLQVGNTQVNGRTPVVVKQPLAIAFESGNSDFAHLMVRSISAVDASMGGGEREAASWQATWSSLLGTSGHGQSSDQSISSPSAGVSGGNGPSASGSSSAPGMSNASGSSAAGIGPNTSTGKLDAMSGSQSKAANTADRPPLMDYMQQMRHLEAASHVLPQPTDSDRSKPYAPRYPVSVPMSWPTQPLRMLDNPALYERLDRDSLFFAFYYRLVRQCAPLPPSLYRVLTGQGFSLTVVCICCTSHGSSKEHTSSIWQRAS
eukprot:scaffold742_cov395-Prasinococcus_capsulatus_cf.AAC.5